MITLINCIMTVEKRLYDEKRRQISPTLTKRILYDGKRRKNGKFLEKQFYTTKMEISIRRKQERLNVNAINTVSIYYI